MRAFAETEFYVYTVPEPSETVGAVIKGSVFVYFGTAGWTARVTQALGTEKRPPSNEWMIADE